MLSATLPGATTIRAFNYEEKYLKKFYKLLDESFKVRIFINASSNFYRLMIDFLSISFLLFIMILLIFLRDKFSSQSTALMLTYYVVMQDNVFKFFGQSSIFERALVSFERCMKYFNIPQEKEKILKIDEDIIKSNWPFEGKIEFRNYSVKYRPENEIILKGLNFVINGGEKIGVVGRTGSGKSTLCLSLFRILEPLSGTILIDNVDIQKIGLKVLRSNITIIPQVISFSYILFFLFF